MRRRRWRVEAPGVDFAFGVAGHGGQVGGRQRRSAHEAREVVTGHAADEAHLQGGGGGGHRVV